MAYKHRYQIIPILELHPQLDTSPTTDVWICMLGLYRLVTPKHTPKVACRITQGHVIEYSTGTHSSEHQHSSYGNMEKFLAEKRSNPANWTPRIS